MHNAAFRELDLDWVYVAFEVAPDALAGAFAGARALGIGGLSVTIPLGSVVEPLPEGDRYLGFLFACGEDPDEVERALRTAHSCLQVVLRPG